MNLEQVYGVLRALVPAIVAFLVAANVIPGEDTSAWIKAILDVLAAVVALVAMIWSILKNRKSATMARVAAMPEVKQMVLSRDYALMSKFAPYPNVLPSMKDDG